MLRTNHAILDFIPKVDAISVQKEFSMTLQHKRYYTYAEALSH